MSNEQLIIALKNPEYRKSLGNSFIHPSGSKLTELSLDEMKHIQGAGDVQADVVTSPVCAAAAAALIATSLPCATGAGLSAVATMLLSLKIC